MFLSRLTKREKYITYISITIVACVFFDRIVFAPVMNKLESLNAEILIQEKKLQKLRNILLQEDLITGEYKKYAQHIKQEGSDEEAIAILLSNIEKMAKNSSVSIIDMKPAPVEKLEFYKRYTIGVEVEAKIDNLSDFIYQLEKTPQLLRVAEFRLSPKKKETAVLRIHMVVTEILII